MKREFRSVFQLLINLVQIGKPFKTDLNGLSVWILV